MSPNEEVEKINGERFESFFCYNGVEFNKTSVCHADSWCQAIIHGKNPGFSAKIKEKTKNSFQYKCA